MKVKAGAAGKDIAANGLQDIAGLYITAITRPGTWETFQDVAPTFELQLGDVLWFTTDLDGVKYLLKDPRLEATQAADAHKLKGRQIYRHLVQATVSPDSALIGHTVREMRFRTYYEGVVLAIHRQSGYVSLRDVCDVELRAGDVLLLEADQSFKKRFKANPAFGLVADVPRSAPLKTRLMWPALGLTAAMVATQIISGFTGTSNIDLWPAAILTAAAMLLIGCMTSDQAVEAIDWTVYITIAFAFGVSSAMERSKVAAAIASIFVKISHAIGGRTAALGSMYLVTGLLSEVLTNNAAAALMYPIAANVGDDMGIQPKLMSIAVMLGASAAFISPFGYQCNLMVFTAGNYKTMDFVRLGVLLQVWQLVAACTIFSLPSWWMILCAISLAVVALAVAYAVASSLLAKRRLKQLKAAASSAGK
uniref:RCK C-terminal domain-containing protein n=1 Tax=Tetradesmus obliquus TaxID=3088 RepID=A0A383WLM6_TETOB|eukprot:jgi/Sobl393_1/13113/SZX78367.1